MVLPFLEGSVRAAGERQRTAGIVHSLQRAENLRTREELARSRQRWAAVGSAACPAGPWVRLWAGCWLLCVNHARRHILVFNTQARWGESCSHFDWQ